ncbi:hypothetical protein BH09BAC4_BH09BAC4_25750 [soil metagenome]
MERLLHFIERYPLDFISYLSSSLPIIIGYFRLSSLKGNLRIIWYLFIFFFLKDTYALVHMFLIPDILYVQNLEAIIETIIVGFIFLYSFDNSLYKKLLIVLTIICAAITIIFYKSTDVSSISLSAFRLFSIILSLSYFNKVLTDMRVKSITRHSMFWFTAGLLIYAAGTFFIVLFSEYWYKDINKVPAEVFDKYWNASQILFIIFGLFSAYGLWTSKYDQENLI